MTLLLMDELLTADLPRLREHFDSLVVDAGTFVAGAAIDTPGHKWLMRYAQLAGEMSTLARILIARLARQEHELDRRRMVDRDRDEFHDEAADWCRITGYCSSKGCLWSEPYDGEATCLICGKPKPTAQDAADHRAEGKMEAEALGRWASWNL